MVLLFTKKTGDKEFPCQYTLKCSCGVTISAVSISLVFSVAEDLEWTDYSCGECEKEL